MGPPASAPALPWALPRRLAALPGRVPTGAAGGRGTTAAPLGRPGWEAVRPKPSPALGVAATRVGAGAGALTAGTGRATTAASFGARGAGGTFGFAVTTIGAGAGGLA